MSSQLRVLLDRFGAMETRVLLLRYRAGGLLPEAEAALLEVLSERGYAGAVLERKATAPDEATRTPTSSPMAFRVKRSHPDLRGFNLALRWLVAPVLLFFLLLAIPIIGNLVVIGGVSALGCRTGEDAIHSCHFLYWDIGELVYGYTIDAFIAGAANPIISCFAFFAFVRRAPGAVWLSVVIGIFVVREVKRYRIQQRGQCALLARSQATDSDEGVNQPMGDDLHDRGGPLPKNQVGSTSREGHGGR